MPDENTGAAEAAPNTPAVPQEKTAPDAVPYSRFQETNEQAKQLKAQLAEVQAQLREKEEADLSAAEKEKAARSRAEQEAAEARAEAASLKRGRLIAGAAKEAGFVDADIAAEMLASRSDIESEAQARKAVEALGKRIPALLKQQQAPPQIGRVLEDGSPVDPQQASEAAGKRQFEDSLREAVGFPTQ
jgi:hypothetical protein